MRDEPTTEMQPVASMRPSEPVRVSADTYPPGMPFEAKVLREAALACQMARIHNCSITVHIGGRLGKPPVDVTVTPNG